MSAFCFLLLASSLVSAEAPIAWRNDGTGIYPDTHPPLHWQQVSKAVADLRYQSSPPAGEAPSGKPMLDGVVRDWLVIGPFGNTQDEKKNPTDPLFAEDESKLSPKKGEQAGDAAWKQVTLENPFLDFAASVGSGVKPGDQAAYAFTYIYSPQDAALSLTINHTGGICGWLNGKLLQAASNKDMNYSTPSIPLKKGWNRLLFRCNAMASQTAKGVTQWFIDPVLRAAPGKSSYESQNIRWKTMLPSVNSFGPPVVIGGKIFLTSEPADLVCIDEATGKILWIRSNNYDELATAEEKAANADSFKGIAGLQQKLKAINDSFVAGNLPKILPMGGNEGFKDKIDTEKKIYSLMQDVNAEKYTQPKGQGELGFAGQTPITDGKHVWCWFATGVTCCYDVNGNLVWRRLDNEGSFFEHGYSVSPVMADGKIVVFMNKLLAFDAKSGEPAWKTPLSGLALTRFHGTPAVANVGGKDVIVLPPGHIVRASDGKIIHDKGPEVSGRQQEIPSPVAIGNTVYELSTFSYFSKVALPNTIGDPLNVSAQTLKFDVAKYPTFYNDWFMASPLIYDGLAYCVNNSGVLVVIDTNSMKVVYEQILDVCQYGNSNSEGAARGLGSSPALAGGNIYIVGASGVTLVLKPGRTFEPVAKNKIEYAINRYYGQRHERFVASPVFDGGNLFLRSERCLYCVSE